MPQLKETRNVSRPIDEVFAYTADFANIAEWDPGVARSVRTDGTATDAQIGLGTRFDLDVVFGSRSTSMTYTITEFDPPNRVVLTGVGGKLTAVDDIRFRSIAEGTEIDYTADLEFGGVMKLLAPLLAGKLRKVGEDALDGLTAKLNGVV